jgi:hypothetical protein
MSDSRGAVVIPDVGTIYFGAYRMTGEWGALEADKGVLVTSDGRVRRLPAPVRRRHDDLPRRVDVQARAWMGGSRRTKAGRLRGRSAVGRLHNRVMPRRARILTWNGKDVPTEVRDLPAGRYVLEAVA